MQLEPFTAPELTLPTAEANLLKSVYAESDIILEYGSGGSTFLAGEMGKIVFSVESDISWAKSMAEEIERLGNSDRVRIHHADIGETGAWGRPNNHKNWKNYYKYPTSIWLEDYFRNPDLVFIDGRLRPACFMAALLFSDTPIRILFDDYINRSSYHVVEEIAKPVFFSGRMALFEINPSNVPKWAFALFSELCTKVSLAPSGSSNPDPYKEISSFVLEKVNSRNRSDAQG